MVLVLVTTITLIHIEISDWLQTLVSWQVWDIAEIFSDEITGLLFAQEASWRPETLKHLRPWRDFCCLYVVCVFVRVGHMQACVCEAYLAAGFSVMAQNFLSNWVKEDIKVGRRWGLFGGSGE